MTGHTGFKGGWLALWLHALGAALRAMRSRPRPSRTCSSAADHRAQPVAHDSRTCATPHALGRRDASSRPEIVLHMAAQPLVRRILREPVEHLADERDGHGQPSRSRARHADGSAPWSCVTTDKCYENRDGLGYRETDALGGHDPYSASKAGAELVVRSYRAQLLRQCRPLVASARAGNVIGGGDWSEDRLVADAARAASTGSSSTCATRMRRGHGSTCSTALSAI